MKTETRLWQRVQLACLFVLSIASTAALAQSSNPGFRTSGIASDVSGLASKTDSRVINPWGLVVSTNKLIVAENGSGLLSQHPLDGTTSKTSIIIPAAGGGTNLGTPTGLVTNSIRANFILSREVSTNQTRRARASLLYVTEDGTIGGWNSSLARTNGIIAVDNSGSGAVYTAAALAATTNEGPLLFVANFSAGVIEAYDTNFTLVRSFGDPTIPEGFGPYGLRVIQRKLFVTYAKQLQPDRRLDEPGVGNGFVDIFNFDGALVRTFASNGPLNSPWALAVAPTRFGIFSGTLLVGNTGDGLIHSYNLITGEFLGTLNTTNGEPLTISGLHALVFNRELPADRLEYDATRLFFTAGINERTSGLIGSIRAASPTLPPMR